MLRRLFWAWLTTALVFAIMVAVMPGIDVDWEWGSYLWIAAVFGVVNIVLGPIMRLLSLPLTVITLGLFSFVIDGVLLLITAWLVDSLDVDGLLPAIFGGIVLGITAVVVDWILRRSVRAANR
jgi:putative membrane protein